VLKHTQNQFSPLVSRPAPKFSSAVKKSKKSSSSWAEFERMAKRAKQASTFPKSLAHEFRLLILCLLCEGEKSVADLEEVLLMRQSSVSQHLARLRRDGLVQPKRNGKAVHYSLATDDVRLMVGTLHDLFCKSPRRHAR
jgi:DNA-binding transcriptional ArsR family regulator